MAAVPLLDPTIAGRRDLDRALEYEWRGKVWQKGKGSRGRAIATFELFVHAVIVGKPNKNHKGYNFTSFATEAEFNAFMLALPDDEKLMFELMVRNSPGLFWHPVFDIENWNGSGAAEPDKTAEDVLGDTVAGLQSFFETDYGIVITSENLILLRSKGSKTSFHGMIPSVYLGNYEDFMLRLKAAARRDKRLRWVDLCIYGSSWLLRHCRQRKLGKSNALMPTRAFAGMQFIDSEALAPHEHLAHFRGATDGMTLLAPITPAPPAAVRKRRAGKKSRKGKKAAGTTAEEPEQLVVDAAVAAVQALPGHATSAYQGCYDDDEMYFMTGDAGRTCACTGEHHVSNNFIVEYDECTRRLEYVCHAPSCRGKSVNIGTVPAPATGHWERTADRVVTPVFDANNLPSMPRTGVGLVSEVWRAPPGTGKTKAARLEVAEILKQDPTASIIVITPLQELAKETFKKFEDLGFKHYKDAGVREGGRINARLLVVCANSLAKVDWDSYDHLFFDEPNKVMRDIPTMDRSLAVYTALLRYMSGAQKNTLMDGYADGLVQLLLKHAGIDATTVWTQVDFVNHPGRTAELLYGGTLTAVADRVMEDFAAGKRVAVAAATKKSAHALCEILIARIGAEASGAGERPVWLLTGQTKKATAAMMLGRLSGGFAPPVFIYTSTLEVGCSYEKPLFHAAYALVADNLTAEAIMQMLARWRHLIDNAVTLWFPPTIVDSDEARWEFDRSSDGRDALSLDLPVATKAAALAHLREHPPQGSVHFYTCTRAKAVFRVRRRRAASLYTLEQAENWVTRNLALNAVRKESEVTGVPLSDNILDWEARVGDAAVQAHMALGPDAEKYRELRAVLHVDKSNCRSTIEPTLVRYLALQGAVVTKHHLDDPDETDKEELAQAMETVSARLAGGPDVEWPTEEQSIELLARSRRGALDEDDRARLDVAFFQHTYGPHENEDGTERFALAPELWDSARMAQHRVLNSLVPEEDDERPLPERLRDLAAKPTSQERVLEHGAIREVTMMECYKLLNLCEFPITSLTDFDDITENRFPAVPVAARELMERMEGMVPNQLVNASNKVALGHLKTIVRKSLGIELYNDSKYAFSAASGHANRNRPRLRRIGPPISREQHDAYNSWQNAAHIRGVELRAEARAAGLNVQRRRRVC